MKESDTREQSLKRQNNGVAERLNRTLVESARSMLLDANLSKCYWAEEVSTAVYLKNRCPTKAVQGKTPYEARNEEKPKACHLRVFGCDAYAHIPKDERGKFKGIDSMMSPKGRHSTVETCILTRHQRMVKKPKPKPSN